MDHFNFFYPGQLVTAAPNAGATKDCEFILNGMEETEIAILQIGDTAIVACGVELGTRSYLKIKKQSPFKYTIILEFAVKKGGGYLVEEDLYEKMCYQSRKTKFYRGAAEAFQNDVIDSLHTVWNASHL